jgi:N-carbamoyl-L-amino-acid hydrolase
MSGSEGPAGKAESPGLLLAKRMFDRLARETADPPGVTRASYGGGEQFAHDLARAEGEKLGFEAATDAAGNLYLRWPGREPGLPAIIVGSHMDSVPHGGNYDGAAGVVAGLAAAAHLQSQGFRPRRDLVVMAIRAEESTWFPVSYIGSRCALGLFPADQLESARRADSGRSLAAHIRQAGFQPEQVRRGVAQVDRAQTAAFLEVHIEQGPVLLGADRPLGLVTGIRGSFRYREARCLGAYAHSGATPRDFRQDSVLGFADLVTGLEGEWDRVAAEDGDLTITFGQVSTDPAQHAFSKVAGEVGFCVDVRSQSPDLLTTLRQRIESLCGEIAARRGVRFELGPLSGSKPAVMDPDLRRRLQVAAQGLGIESLVMASGAGHDAAVFADAGIPSAMVFIRNRHGSHNPEEAMELVDFDLAVRLLARFLTDFD